MFEQLKQTHKLPESGVNQTPYDGTELESRVVAILRDGVMVDHAGEGHKIELVLADTPFYVESGGQVSDTGQIVQNDSTGTTLAWEMEVTGVYKPINGLIVHDGLLTSGTVKVGDPAWVSVDYDRRWDIRRNHTATHILHRELRRTLGDHVAQAGSLVAPDRLRFD